jgi:hypothetical protein
VIEGTALLGKQGMWDDIQLTIRTSCYRRDGRRDVGVVLSTQRPCDVLQPGQAEISALAQILFGKALVHCQVGRPVAVTTLFDFLACGIVAALAHKGKG